MDLGYFYKKEAAQQFLAKAAVGYKDVVWAKSGYAFTVGKPANASKRVWIIKS